MASRVNVKFVVILASALVMVLVLTSGVFFFVKMRSGSRYASLGDQAMARGDIKAADKFYSQAVNKDRTNVAYLKKWQGALSRKVPDTETKYVEDYKMLTYGILNSLATVQRSDVNAQCEYLQALYEQRMTGAIGGRESWDQLVEQVNQSLAFFEPEQPVAIRRYRGLAVAGLITVTPDVPKDKLETGQKDLEAAVAANPKDTTATDALMSFYRSAAKRAREHGDAAGYAAALDKARQTVAASLAAAPNDPQAILDELISAMSDIDLGIEALPAVERAKAQADSAKTFQPRVAAAGEQLLKADPKLLSASVVQIFAAVAISVDRDAGSKQAMAVVNRSLEGTPDNADVMLIGAEIAGQQGNTEDRIARYDALIKLPRRPVSLSGLRLSEQKRRAQFLQTDAITSLIATAKPEERAAAFDRAQKSREQLATVVADTSPELKFIDAKLLLFKGDLVGAQGKLADFIRTPGEAYGQVLNARLMMGDLAMKLQPPQPGLARENYRAVVLARPGATNVKVALADVEFLLDNRADALALYKEVLVADPGNERATRQVEVLTQTAQDPILKVLVEADRLAHGADRTLGDEKAALAAIDKALEPNHYDARLVNASVIMHVTANDNAGAQQVVSGALGQRPDDENLKTLQKRLQAANSVEGLIALIDSGNATPLDKALSKQRVYEAYGKADEAKAALAEAAKIGPDDPRVIEGQFLSAMLRPDYAEASRIADHGAQLNADRADGDTYRARLQFGQGNFRDAATILERAVKRGNASAPLYRLYGLTLMQLGRGPDAVDAYRRALDLNPSDVASIKAYLVALFQTGQKTQALGTARDFESRGRRDPEFFDMWMQLEAETGGRVQFAREKREEMRAQAPDNAGNNAALADLYIRERSFDKARALIDEMRSKKDSLNVTMLDARWYAAKGDFDRAGEVYKAYAAKVDGAERTQAYQAYGQFMLQAGKTDVGLAALRQAAEGQDPKTMPIDLQIGDALLSTGRYKEAEDQYRKVLAAKVDDSQHLIHKRVIEAMIQQGKLKEAEQEFVALGDVANSDVELIAQRAQLLRDLGRGREAHDLLDQSIQKFPDEALLYLRRARLEIADPAYAADAMADLGTAIKLRPGFWQALRMRARLNLSAKKYDDAIKDLQAAADAAPSLDDLRTELITLELSQNRDSEAIASADAGLKLRPNDLQYLATLGECFARAGRWARAAGYYKQMLAQRADDGVAARTVYLLLKVSPPAINDAEAVLATPGLDVDKSWQLLVARAAIRKEQQRDGPMQADCVAALEIANGPDEFVGAFEAMRRVDAKPVKVIAMLDRAMTARSPNALMTEWAMVARGSEMLDDPATRSDGSALLLNLATTAQDRAVRVNASRGANTRYLADHQYDKALEAALAGLAVTPDDPMLNNNAACVLNENLNKPAEAVPYAEKAIAQAPDDLNIVDTLASVYWATSAREKAVATAEAGLRRNRTDADKAQLAVKLGGWKLQLGDKVGAKVLLDFCQGVLTEYPNLPIKPQMDQLKKDLEAAQ